MNIDLDGTIEIFNNGIEQRSLLKIYDKFSPKLDICIWAFFPSDRDCNNQMKVLIGHLEDCLFNNMWKEDVPFKIFTQVKAINLHKEARDYILQTIISKTDKVFEPRKEQTNG